MKADHCCLLHVGVLIVRDGRHHHRYAAITFHCRIMDESHIEATQLFVNEINYLIDSTNNGNIVNDFDFVNNSPFINPSGGMANLARQEFVLRRSDTSRVTTTGAGGVSVADNSGDGIVGVNYTNYKRKSKSVKSTHSPDDRKYQVDFQVTEPEAQVSIPIEINPEGGRGGDGIEAPTQAQLQAQPQGQAQIRADALAKLITHMDDDGDAVPTIIRP